MLFHIAVFKQDLQLLRKVRHARWASHIFYACFVSINVFPHSFNLLIFPCICSRVQRLSSLLILSQLVNQFTEVAVPFIVDRFFSSAQKELKEDDPAADHMQAEGSLPPFPVSSSSHIQNSAAHISKKDKKASAKFQMFKKGLFCLLNKRTILNIYL